MVAVGAVGRGVLLGTSVLVGLGDGVEVSAGIGVGVEVGVSLGSSVGVSVAVGVGLGVDVGAWVGTDVVVDVNVLVKVGEEVAEEANIVSLASAVSVAISESSTGLTVPKNAKYAVTATPRRPNTATTIGAMTANEDFFSDGWYLASLVISNPPLSHSADTTAEANEHSPSLGTPTDYFDRILCVQ